MKDQPIGSKRFRRQHDRSFRDGLVAKCLVPGASVSAIAMDGGVNANLLFKWRREHVRAKALTTAAPVTLPTQANLLPVCVVESPAVSDGPVADEPCAHSGGGDKRHSTIELEIAGARLRLSGAVDETVLCSVLRALRQTQ